MIMGKIYRVFLVDDEVWILVTLQKIIDWRKYGFEICGTARDGQVGLERIKNLKPDLIFSDIKMPGMNGIEFIRELRNEKIDAEVVVVSGYSDFEYAKSALKFGCMDYLMKPVDEEELIACLNRFITRYEEENNENYSNEESEGMNEVETADAYLSERRLSHLILLYIQENFQSVSLQSIADEFNMSISAVSQLVKNKTGKSYSKHLLEIRIEKAQELLRNTNDSIETVAEKVGYSDYFYFMKFFKKATGMSPSEYRKNL